MLRYSSFLLFPFPTIPFLSFKTPPTPASYEMRKWSQISLTHWEISQLFKSSLIKRLRRSIDHSVYILLAAAAARRWAGPIPPSLASSRVLQTHVARFLPWWSGVPNQYLESVSISLLPFYSGQTWLTSRSHHFSLLQRELPYRAVLGASSP